MDCKKLGLGFLLVGVFVAASCSSELAAKRKQNEACKQAAMAEARNETEAELIIKQQCE